MHKRNRIPGFTIVELLIVIVIIGILVTIVIVAYNGITRKAQDATLQSDLKNASIGLEMSNVTDGSYPNASPDLKHSPNTTLSYSHNSTDNTYCLEAGSAKTADTYFVTSGGNILAGTCAAFNGAIPSVTSPTATSVMAISATLGATVTADGGLAISARGVCWGQTPNPTTCVAQGGTSTGSFTQSVSTLTASTLYYFRGYATNSKGTAYSPDGTFTTSASCFLAGTMISTPSGTLAIEDIKVGDEVLSWDDGRVIVTKVKQVFVLSAPGFYTISTLSGSIDVTGAHPLMTTSGYERADQVRVGEMLVRQHSSQGVLSVGYIDLPSTVYNFEVDEPHNYFANGFLVHNKPS